MPERTAQAETGMKPCTYGCWLAYIGALIKLVCAIGALAGFYFGYSLNLLGNTLLSLWLSLILAILILIFAYLMCPRHMKWAAYVVIVLAILNIAFGYDLFYIGSILAIIGAVIVLRYCYR